MKLNQYSLYSTSVLFEDLDAAGVVHHPHYLKYLERARLSFMDDEEVPYVELAKSGVAIPVVEVHQKFRKPLIYAQKINIYSKIIKVTSRSVSVYQVIADTALDISQIESEHKFSEIIFEATITLVSIDLKSMRSIEHPAIVKKLFGVN